MLHNFSQIISVFLLVDVLFLYCFFSCSTELSTLLGACVSVIFGHKNSFKFHSSFDLDFFICCSEWHICLLFWCCCHFSVVAWFSCLINYSNCLSVRMGYDSGVDHVNDANDVGGSNCVCCAMLMTVNSFYFQCSISNGKNRRTYKYSSHSQWFTIIAQKHTHIDI